MAIMTRKGIGSYGGGQKMEAYKQLADRHAFHRYA